MAPASQEPEPASAATTRPDSDSSVDNIAQNFCLELSTGVRPVLLPWVPGHRASQFRAYAPLLSPALLHHLAPFAVVLSSSLIRSKSPSIRTGAVWTLPCAVWALRGEQAASALEANLTNLENRLDALLAAFEASEGGAEAPKDTSDTHNGKSPDGTSPNGQKHNEGSGPDAVGAAKKP
ncbi:hypothetical protein CcaCcLH18_04056 [Colletotrichum camelliae]|nr:hypothetical protein CcaCcLH18_04056 [Colletotrichum camelliae]